MHKGGHPIRNRCQFSWYCDGINDVPRNLRAYDRSKYLAEWLLLAKDWLVDLSDGSLYYHAYYVSPKWSKVRKKTVQVDSHIFYK
jgi:spore germination cell wall hydrolase CwlJ-like protein